MSPLAEEVSHSRCQHVSEHPRKMLLLVLFLVRTESQIEEALVEALLEEPAEDLEG